mmetsp:Transcript_33364/g.60283  ORF Transcript_33364/g.60283 Transcript_33364/m.60283 type:complete len:339 (-) Transcript_33364:190-1206(-)
MIHFKLKHVDGRLGTRRLKIKDPSSPISTLCHVAKKYSPLSKDNTPVKKNVFDYTLKIDTPENISRHYIEQEYVAIDEVISYLILTKSSNSKSQTTSALVRYLNVIDLSVYNIRPNEWILLAEFIVSDFASEYLHDGTIASKWVVAFFQYFFKFSETFSKSEKVLGASITSSFISFLSSNIDLNLIILLLKETIPSLSSFDTSTKTSFFIALQNIVSHNNLNKPNYIYALDSFLFTDAEVELILQAFFSDENLLSLSGYDLSIGLVALAQMPHENTRPLAMSKSAMLIDIVSRQYPCLDHKGLKAIRASLSTLGVTLPAALEQTLEKRETFLIRKGRL